jgi:copper chaperone
MVDYTLDVRGMSCEGCEHILRSELTGLSGVGDVEADADAGEVRIYGDPATEALARQTILDAGYDLAE